jgi:hypothetical protein
MLLPYPVHVIKHVLKTSGIFNKTLYFCIFIKGKAVPLQAWTGPEGSRRSRLPDF